MVLKGNVQRGSITILTTLALIAMCGLMGLAVDLGWSYYVKKSEQAAADSAALAAVAWTKAHSATWSCSSSNFFCSLTPVNCSSIANTSNVHSACLYAEKNGFKDGADNVTVTVAANACASPCDSTDGGPPTAPGVKVYYWVTVRVNQQVSQLFSAVLGNATGLVSARATAALANETFKASLDLLNRENDLNPINGTGVNLVQQGGNTLISQTGMYVSSDIVGAAQQGGSSKVDQTPFSYFLGGGTCTAGGNQLGNCLWQAPWQNNAGGNNQSSTGIDDGKQFYDPTLFKKNWDQPPVYSAGQPLDIPIDINTNKGFIGPGNGVISGSGTATDPWILPPAAYYAASCSGSGNTRSCVPTGGTMSFDKGYYQFAPSLNSTTFAASYQYQFYGGLNTATGAATTVTFTPGRYVFAGTTGTNPQFNVGNSTIINDNPTNMPTTGVSGVYPGEIFVFTNQNYSTTNPSPTVLTASSNLKTYIDNGTVAFNFGETGFKTGNNSNSGISLNGLNANLSYPDNLQDWAPFLLWQDRADSRVVYCPGGPTACPGGAQDGIVPPVNGACPGSAFPEQPVNGSNNIVCAQNPNPDNPNAPQMDLNANVNLNLHGAVYQPRGSWLSLQAAGGLSVPIQLVTGALRMQGSATVTLTGLSNPITFLVIALIE